MKDLTKMSRLIGYLEKLYRRINTDIFQDELPEPMITVSPTKNAYGHMTTWKAWATPKGRKVEVNISSYTLSRPIENTIATLIHELTHLYCQEVLHVKDTSRNGQYHNKVFKEQGEKHWLTLSYDNTIGWSPTQPSERLLEWICDNSYWIIEIETYRDLAPDYKPPTSGNGNNGSPIIFPKSNNSHSIKYQCPCCGNSCRATKQINIICADCMESMFEC